MLAPLKRWLDERLALGDVRKMLAHKRVPVHSRTLWYFFGGITLFLFGIQFVTGMLLLLYYRPSPNEAFESVQFIMTRVHFGWLIRSIHSWSANLMILSALVHMFSAFFLRAYGRPRELTWLSGMVLLFLALAFGFSGYLLPWNTLAFFATKVGTQSAGVIPFAGPLMLKILRGGEDVTGATLTRFFGFHVAILPVLTIVLLLFHLALVQKWGIGSPKPGSPTMPFFPNFALRELMAWYSALAILGGLAAFLPWELGEKADPFAPAPAGIRPEWYFLSVFYTLKLVPSRIWIFEGEVIGILCLAVGMVVWTLVPFWGQRLEAAGKLSWLRAIGVFLIAYLVVFSALGYWK